LETAHKFAASTLESAILINDGTGRFRWKSLPRLAQTSPGFGLALTEVDGDGRADLYVVQNFYHPQIETGRMGGGVSLLLLGRGDGEFSPVMPGESGLVSPGDGKSLTTADVDGDGRLDFVVGNNDGPVQAFASRRATAGRVVTVRLVGRPGNPTAAGARVTLHLDDGSHQTAEVQAGSGYLSQSPPTLTFGAPAKRRVAKVEVAWPDGTRSSVSPPADTPVLRLEQPPPGEVRS
jgi:hypothetical protein